MIRLFAAALCNAFRTAGHGVLPYFRCSALGRNFWDAKAMEVLPGVIAAHLWRS